MNIVLDPVALRTMKSYVSICLKGLIFVFSHYITIPEVLDLHFGDHLKFHGSLGSFSVDKILRRQHALFPLV